ncbi:MAG: GntR family transcriptional regulator [Oscillospiraceae bacterium]|nr:GntR family transcriptional regulator [Oscillospiraceae bacterium]
MAKQSKQTLGEQAYEALKHKIMSMPSNSYISARSAATELNMSYTPVREALLRLHQEGLIKQIPNVGFLVETTDLSDHIKFYQVRECIEPFVLKKVFHLISQEHIDSMERFVELQKVALENDDIRNFIENDIYMHQVLFNLLDNRYLTDFYLNLRSTFSINSFHLSKVGHPTAIEEHLSLIEAIRKKDIQAALDATLSHIVSTRLRLVSS